MFKNIQVIRIINQNGISICLYNYTISKIKWNVYLFIAFSPFKLDIRHKHSPKSFTFDKAHLIDTRMYIIFIDWGWYRTTDWQKVISSYENALLFYRFQLMECIFQLDILLSISLTIAILNHDKIWTMIRICYKFTIYRNKEEDY